MKSLLSLSLVFPFVLSWLPQLARAQFDYNYDDYGSDYAPGWDCAEGTYAANSWQCYLCGGTQYPGTGVACLANYTNFDYQQQGSNEDTTGLWAFMDLTITDESTTPAIAPYSCPNHAYTMSPQTVTFSRPYNNPNGLASGRLHAFYFACSDGANTAVACKLTIDAWLVKTMADNSTEAHLVSETWQYTPGVTTYAPMMMVNFTPVADANYKQTKAYTIEKYAFNYTLTAKQTSKKAGRDDAAVESTDAMIHVDNMETSWWYGRG